MKKLIAVAGMMALLAACGGKSNEAPAEGAANTEGAAEAAKPAAPAEYKTIAELGIQIEVPGDATIDAAAGPPANATISAGACTVMLMAVTDMSDSFEGLVKSADAGVGNKAEKWVKKEKTADGFHVEFQGKSMMDDAITDITIRRTVGDKQIDCARAGSADEVACVATWCATIKPAN
ncbi:MAG: hypothetical protein EP329_16705 [Deltaproteobacteria bacterium]|nr:MAG: hypothetical protein EP329_16705 [Deltaproteobacteria bacterium]